MITRRAFILLLAAALLHLGARQAAALDFVSPAPNSVVQPGTTIVVKVAPTGNEQLVQVAFATSAGVTTAAAGVFDAQVPIPLDAVGPELIIAQATLVGGGFAIEILQLIADPGSLLQLSVAGPGTLDVVGQVRPLQVTGLFTDGVTRDLTHPDRGTTYQSSDATVLGIDPTGLIQARARGNAQVLVQTHGLAKTMAVHVEIPSPPPNRIPVPNAGPDQTVTAETLVELAGGASSDPDGDPLQYRWEQISGRIVIMREETTATPNFVAPRVTAGVEVLEFSLVVSDDKGATSFGDTVQVQVTP